MQVVDNSKLPTGQGWLMIREGRSYYCFISEATASVPIALEHALEQAWAAYDRLRRSTRRSLDGNTEGGREASGGVSPRL